MHPVDRTYPNVAPHTVAEGMLRIPTLNGSQVYYGLQIFSNSCKKSSCMCGNSPLKSTDPYVL